ncbi:hypothetical protein AGDE_15015 [Angomonas deanei]|nr:hypothetical protein AGDE_15015 [Angomonas deanei]|eukprot:EPY19829.1 hypothetical protein AGDE_15015 [Angomonas deanei]
MLSPLQVHQSGQSTPYLTSFSPKTTERTVKTSRFMIADHSAQDERTIIDMLDMGEEDDDEELLWLDKNLAYEGEEAAAGGGGGSELLQEEAAEWPAAVRSDSTLIQTNEPSGGYWAMTEGPMIYLRPDVLLFANRGHTPVQGNSRKRTFSTHNNNNNSTTIPRTPLSSSIGYRSTYLDHTVSMETSGFYYGPNNNDNEEEEEHWEWEENSSAYEDSLDEAQIQWIEEQLRTREGSA